MAEITMEALLGLLMQLESEVAALKSEISGLIWRGLFPNGDDDNTLMTNPAVPHGFRCRKSGPLSLFMEPGRVYYKGVQKTIASWPASNTFTVSATTTNYIYLTVEFATATVTWASATSDPGDGDDDTEYIMLAIIVAGTTPASITSITQHTCGDIHIYGNA